MSTALSIPSGSEPRPCTTCGKTVSHTLTKWFTRTRGGLSSGYAWRADEHGCGKRPPEWFWRP